MTDETFEQALQDPDKLIRILINLKNERAKNKEFEEKIKSDLPKIVCTLQSSVVFFGRIE
jgi:hypothetical protein